MSENQPEVGSQATLSGSSHSSIEAARIPLLAPSFYYIPNFVTVGEEAQLLAKINSSRWIQLSHRRLQVYPSILTPRNILLPTSPLPKWLTTPVIARLTDLGVFSSTPHATPNHVLINEYEPGQGIMPHEDGDAYAPVVATVSLGAPIVLDIYEKKGDGSGEREDRPKWRVLQEERSLLVTRGQAYKVLLHGIGELSCDEDLAPDSIVNWALLGDTTKFADDKMERRTRVSLTFRDVLKVSNVASKLLGKR